jgi:hypothetical protein
MRLGLKTNKNKSTQVGLNILGLNMGSKNGAFQYGAFLTALYTHAYQHQEKYVSNLRSLSMQ